MRGDQRPGRSPPLNGLYDAKLDHVPVVAIVGQTERSAMGGSYQQEIDLISLFKDVCSEYVQMCTVPQQLPNLIDRAIRIALSESRSDVHHCPVGRLRADVRGARARVQAGALEPGDGSGSASSPTTTRCAGRRPAQRRREGRDAGRPGRPWSCVEELTEVADLLGAGVAKALLGKDVLPDDLPWVTGVDRAARHHGRAGI